MSTFCFPVSARIVGAKISNVSPVQRPFKESSLSKSIGHDQRVPAEEQSPPANPATLLLYRPVLPMTSEKGFHTRLPVGGEISTRRPIRARARSRIRVMTHSGIPLTRVERRTAALCSDTHAHAAKFERVEAEISSFCSSLGGRSPGTSHVHSFFFLLNRFIE